MSMFCRLLIARLKCALTKIWENTGVLFNFDQKSYLYKDLHFYRFYVVLLVWFREKYRNTGATFWTGSSYHSSVFSCLCCLLFIAICFVSVRLFSIYENVPSVSFASILRMIWKEIFSMMLRVETYILSSTTYFNTFIKPSYMNCGKANLISLLKKRENIFRKWRVELPTTKPVTHFSELINLNCFFPLLNRNDIDTREFSIQWNIGILFVQKPFYL